ncbi:uncharacterized protein RAG0_14167 [Rhynchosporium agropyri]|uniref:Secreted protein n=1 Tax=Rhynchosporium agropyri TaxID=914238 RepID=A0A1E1LFZ8_9HELO|nr:uncharacterized protein RAG0_14167 [Rhynchosporium agropyri]
MFEWMIFDCAAAAAAATATAVCRSNNPTESNNFKIPLPKISRIGQSASLASHIDHRMLPTCGFATRPDRP